MQTILTTRNCTVSPPLDQLVTTRERPISCLSYPLLVPLNNFIYIMMHDTCTRKKASGFLVWKIDFQKKNWKFCLMNDFLESGIIMIFFCYCGGLWRPRIIYHSKEKNQVLTNFSFKITTKFQLKTTSSKSSTKTQLHFLHIDSSGSKL